jgi:hypothetical protein
MRATLIAWLIIGCVWGCSDATQPAIRDEPRPRAPTEHGQGKDRIVTHDMGWEMAHEFWLTDGTHCVEVINTGITCDWSRQP